MIGMTTVVGKLFVHLVPNMLHYLFDANALEERSQLACSKVLTHIHADNDIRVLVAAKLSKAQGNNLSIINIHSLHTYVHFESIRTNLSFQTHILLFVILVEYCEADNSTKFPGITSIHYLTTEKHFIFPETLKIMKYHTKTI